LPNVKLIEAETLGEEAQLIALMTRQALETPEKRVAIITPDRLLARRIANHLKRWNIEADDSAGRNLCDTPPATLLLGLAQCLASDFAATDVLAVLKHPLASGDMARKDWLSQVRAVDMALRGPRLGLGLQAIDKKLSAYCAVRQKSKVSRKNRGDDEAVSAAFDPEFWPSTSETFFHPLEISTG
jgi:ATP-dependent helicase/nuclease subunit B